MVSNITNTTETSSFPLQDKKAQTQEQVRKEQESFQKLIEQKAKAAQEATKAENTKEVKNPSQKAEDLKTSKSESAQNAAPAPKDFVAEAPSHTETPSTPANTSAQASAQNMQAQSTQASAQNNAKPVQSVQPQSAQAMPAEAKPQNNAPEMPKAAVASSAAMMAEGMKDGEINEGVKTLADVKNLGDEKALKVGDMKLESSAQNNAQSVQNAASTQAKVVNNSIKPDDQKESLESMSKNEAKPEGMSTQALLAQKAAQGSLKAAAMAASPAVDPLAQALKEVTTRDLAARKMSKAEGIEYKKEKGGEKIAVIERGRSLPKNITEANMRNAKRDEAYREVFEKFGVKEETKEDSLITQALSSESSKKKL